ncbi:hypothetical protein Fluta_2715 [Fluviicola taffensis DSM 16823]|uniref:Uncharacterized protein n=1 Tax=Fluviicola taffensis (strain DSM 16823 / NCIMB 13979 / RW262) TaxID=755732 RepID=F2IG61_FLUTR|nr:hypothetical protein Fluta_2715 [Fluviicola taffensis DSM 16823]
MDDEIVENKILNSFWNGKLKGFRIFQLILFFNDNSLKDNRLLSE